jgi:hypothetical protein
MEDELQGARARSANERPDPAAVSEQDWSRRVRTGEQVENLVGLAFSGGGIRSATFNLGVLQGLQEIDFLKKVDYLSTVSGGGYIGSWLLGNVRRSRHWLSQGSNWNPSITHLRRYSNYLAPRTGLMSADTWTMWGIWARNALLIQIGMIVLLSAVLLFSLLAKHLFDAIAASPGLIEWPQALLVLLVGTLMFAVGRSVYKPSRWPERAILGFGVIPAWGGSFIVAAVLWGETLRRDGPVEFAFPLAYSQLLGLAWTTWFWPLAVMLACLVTLAFLSIDSGWKFLAPLFIGPASLGALYLQLCALLLLFGAWAQQPREFSWFAFIFGPPLTLLAITLTLCLFIGLTGRLSEDWRREWWTRLGSWLGIFGVVFLALSVASVLGPLWIFKFLSHPQIWTSAKWGALLSWVGSVAAGLMAGNSNRTKGNGASGSSRVLEVVARVAALVFIVGAVLAASALLHAVLVNIVLEDPRNLDTLYWAHLEQVGFPQLLLAFVILAAGGLILSSRFDINIFGLNQFYRNRLVRCYLGATRWLPGMRKPHPFTGFDEGDDLDLAELKHSAPSWAKNYRGPFPLLNCSLNLGGSSDLGVHTRQSASFFLTPLRCGADRPRVGFARTGGEIPSFTKLTLGQAVSVSGAAASPNMGYNTSPLVAFLLTMFNVRLGWWFDKPGGTTPFAKLLPYSLYCTVQELFGLADEQSGYVNVSDGGHFENLGIYELVRRRCKVIVAADAECDPDLSFGSLANVIRICEVDFGARIDLDIASIRKAHDRSRAHCAVGRIDYHNGGQGYLIYLKSSITGDEDASIEQYRSSHPDFPHETTADQFFSEDQFESYRRLGLHVTRMTFRGAATEPDALRMASQLYDLWAPGGFSRDSFLTHAKTLDEMWERFRKSPGLANLLADLMSNVRAAPVPPTQEELCACLELLQLMENVFLDLRLDEHWKHPDNRGWAMMFTMWAKSARLRGAWNQVRRTFGIRFEYFCSERLGLPRDEPVVRV